MARTSALSINALEKQCATLEIKIIQAKNKKITELEKLIAKKQSDIAKLKAKRSAEKTNLNIAKTPGKKKASKDKQHQLKNTIAQNSTELKTLKAAMSHAKNEYKVAVKLQNIKVIAVKEVANPRRKKRVLGPKIKPKKVSKNTVVPPRFLNIDTDIPVKPLAEPQ